MTRPGGITLIVILCFLAASWGVLAVARLIVGGQFTDLLVHEQRSNQGGLGAILIFVLVAFIALYASAGLGLWKLKRWGRVLTIVLVAVGAGFDLLGLPTTHFQPSAILKTTVTFALYAMIAWYLCRPAIKATFTSANERGHEGTRSE